MKELHADLWSTKASAKVITTNGNVKYDGTNIMGGGCAKEAALIWPYLPEWLGLQLRQNGNHVYLFQMQEPHCYLYTFPTKEKVWENSTLDIIERSCKELVKDVDSRHYSSVVLPRPGCGLGGLEWTSVRQVCEVYLDDRFIIVDNT